MTLHMRVRSDGQFAFRDEHAVARLAAFRWQTRDQRLIALVGVQPVAARTLAVASRIVERGLDQLVERGNPEPRIGIV